MKNKKPLTLLGAGKTEYPKSPNEAKLETFENKHKDSTYLVPFICTEFTSLCPITSQPDFAKFEIIYVPKVKMVESKSLKLYLFSFRNEGSFHEDVTNRIFKDLWQLMDPWYLRVIGDFTVRGGIAIKPFVELFSFDSRNLLKKKIERMVDEYDRLKTGFNEYR